MTVFQQCDWKKTPENVDEHQTDVIVSCRELRVYYQFGMSKCKHITDNAHRQKGGNYSFWISVNSSFYLDTAYASRER